MEAVFYSGVEINLEGSDVNEMYDGIMEKILENLSTFQRRGSGWVFASVVRLEIHTVNYEPLRGPFYIPLPKQLMSKKQLLTLKMRTMNVSNWQLQEQYIWQITMLNK